MKRILLCLCMLMGAVLGATVSIYSQRETSDGVSLQLNECRYAAGLVTCYLKITSNGFDRDIGKGFRFDGKSNWNITDDLGNSFPHKEIWFGGKEKWDSGDSIGRLVADLSTPLNFVFEFRPEAKTIRLLDLYLVVEDKVANFQFRNVPIIDDSPIVFSGKIQAVYNGTALAFEACENQKTSLICKFTAISVGKDRETNTNRSHADLQVVDNLGNYHTPDDVLWGGKRSNTLIADTPTPVILTIPNFSSSATSLSLMQILFQDATLWFRNLSIGVQDNYISSNNNIAYRKRVHMEVRGAEVGLNECNLAQEVTDGIITKKGANCGLDGHVGFQNNDYNELMDVTVKIDLEKTYKISQIRYSQGDVQRAGTWNADFMTTPCGKTATNKGQAYRGSWTEQKCSTTTTILEIHFQKTRKKWEEDWLTIGEIEVIGTAVSEQDASKSTSDVHAEGQYAQLVAKIRGALNREGWRSVVVEATPRDIVVRGEVLDADIPKILALVGSFRPSAMRNELTACPTVKDRCIQKVW